MENQRTSVAALLPIMGAVFIGFLIVGMAMPVLPLHVHQDLGLGTFVVGLVAGSQFAAQLFTRMWAGRHADMRGVKHTVIAGLATAAAAGFLYLLSLRFVSDPATSVTILLLGRALLGAGESFIITGAQSWGLVRAGSQNAGRVLSWMGSAMYAAFALGAPVGSLLYARYGFGAIALGTIVLPLLTLLVVAPLSRAAPAARVHPAFTRVLAAVWLPGCGAALSSVGLGAITAFVGLLFVTRGWDAWSGFTAFAIAFVAARMFFGHLADRIGGAKLALICVIIEAAGLALVWLAPWSVVALTGAALTGFGYALAYPGFGVEAIRRAPAQSQGLAMGAYGVFLDVALGLASPALGLIAGVAGLGSVFLVSALIVLCAAAIAVRLLPTKGARNESSGCDRRVALSHRRNIGSRTADAAA